jgi:PTH1 family peptidyl-tRNA hydrolase
MSVKIKLFAGLGNPGARYKNSRHNFGFKVLDKIAQRKCLEFKTEKNMAAVSFCETKNGKVWLLKPLTFMNLSGTITAGFMRYYKILPEEIFVFYDDFSVKLGKYKIKMNGSSGGHNGINSIIKELNCENFPRMKLGIGPVPKFFKIDDFVLGDFLTEEEKTVDDILEIAVKIFDEINILDVEKAVSKIANLET